MNEEAPAPDRSGLRKFGLISSLILVLLFGLLIPWLLSREIPVWPWLAAATLSAWAVVAPEKLGAVYHIWMKFGYFMNMLNTNIILGILFYGIILPAGLLMRLLGKDPMQRKLDSKLVTYRVNSQKEEREDAERPY